MTQVRAPDIATKEEVLETFTQLMRWRNTTGCSPERRTKRPGARRKLHRRLTTRLPR